VDASEYKLPSGKAAEYRVNDKELKMAKQLIESMADEWKPSDFKDQFSDRLHKVIEERMKQKDLVSHIEGKEEAESESATTAGAGGLRLGGAHQGRRGGLLRGRCSLDAARAGEAPAVPAALPGRRRRHLLLPEALDPGAGQDAQAPAPAREGGRGRVSLRHRRRVAAAARADEYARVPH